VGTPYDINAAVHEIEDGALSLLGANRRLIAIGGDHTIALPMLRAVHKKFGRVAMIHFDAHLDTWDQYFGMKITHGTMFRRAYEEDIFLPDHCIHVGTRGPIYSANDLSEDANMGFKVIRSSDFDDRGFNELVTEARTRLGSAPTYISVDIDVLDPAFAPGTGTPEAGGLISRELLRFLRALRGVDVVGADVVEVAPAYDHSEVTSIQAATVVFDLIALMACSKQQHARVSGEPGC
jgi:agmatinase